jgi:hypothetical protein
MVGGTHLYSPWTARARVWYLRVLPSASPALELARRGHSSSGSRVGTPNLEQPPTPWGSPGKPRPLLPRV